MENRLFIGFDDGKNIRNEQIERPCLCVIRNYHNNMEIVKVIYNNEALDLYDNLTK